MYAVHMMTALQMVLLVIFVLGVGVWTAFKIELAGITPGDRALAMARHRDEMLAGDEPRRRHRADQAGPYSITVRELQEIAELELAGGKARAH